MTVEPEADSLPVHSVPDPIVASVYDLRKAAGINALLTSPAPVLPVELGQPVLPFEIGIFEQFLQRLQPGIAKVRLRRAIGAYASAKNYLLASAQSDAMRHDIDALACAPVNAEDRLTALRRIDALSTRFDPKAPQAGGQSGPPSTLSDAAGAKG